MSYLQRGQDSKSPSTKRARLPKSLWLLTSETPANNCPCVSPVPTSTLGLALHPCAQSAACRAAWLVIVGIDAWGMNTFPLYAAHLPQGTDVQKSSSNVHLLRSVPHPEGSLKFMQTASSLTSSSPPAHPVLQPLPANQSAESTADL